MGTKKEPAKKASKPVSKSTTVTAAKKSAAKKATKSAAKGTAVKTPAAKKAAGSKTAAKKKGADNYTKPELRETIKRDVMAGDKGGKPGQWSARKAQLVAHEYVAEGGGYKHERDETQEHLKEWGDEKWHTASGKPAIRDGETHRYLPDKAWNDLSEEEKKATDEKKVRGSKQGRQFVANTKKAKEARKHATQHKD